MWELGADGYDGRARRTRPTFVDSPESPLIGDAWSKATFRQRVSAWYAAFSSGNPVAGAIYAATIVKSAVYLAFFYYVLRDADVPLFGELNAKRFLLYNLLGACPGVSADSLSLSQRLRVWMRGDARRRATLCAATHRMTTHAWWSHIPQFRRLC